MSVAGLAGASAIISAWLMVNTSIHPYLCILMTAAGAFVAGLINGILITSVKLVPFIATLATGEIFGGLIYVITQGWPIQNIPNEVIPLGRGMVGPVPFPAIIMLLIGLILMIMLKFFPFGRYIFAIGGNERAARITGIKTGKITTIVLRAFRFDGGSFRDINYRKIRRRTTQRRFHLGHAVRNSCHYRRDIFDRRQRRDWRHNHRRRADGRDFKCDRFTRNIRILGKDNCWGSRPYCCHNRSGESLQKR